MANQDQDLHSDLPEDLLDVDPIGYSNPITSLDHSIGVFQSHRQNQSNIGGNSTPGGASANFSDEPYGTVPFYDGPSTSSGTAASFSRYQHELFSPRDNANLIQHPRTDNVGGNLLNPRGLFDEDGDQLRHQTWRDITDAVSSQGLASGFASDTLFPSHRGFASDTLFPSDRGFASDTLFPSNRGFASDTLFPTDQGFASDTLLPSSRGFASDRLFPSDRGLASDPLSPSYRGFTSDTLFPSDRRLASDTLFPSYQGVDDADYERFQQLQLDPQNSQLVSSGHLHPGTSVEPAASLNEPSTYPPAPPGMYNNPSTSSGGQYPSHHGNPDEKYSDLAEITHQQDLNFLKTTTPVGKGEKQKRRNRLKKATYDNMSSQELEQRKKENARTASQEFRRRQNQLKEEYLREYEQLKHKNMGKHQMLAQLGELKVRLTQALIAINIDYRTFLDKHEDFSTDLNKP